MPRRLREPVIGVLSRAGGGVTVAALLLAAAVVLVFARPTLPMDDAYITLHNARALLAGGWDASYDTAAVTGATSAVHLLLIATFGLVLPLEVASQCVTFVALAAYLAALNRMAAQAGADRALILILGSLSAYLPFHVLNGLETGLAMAAVAWALVLANHRHLPILLGVMPFVRPELAVLAGLLMARRCWQQRGDPRRVARDVAIAGLVALPWLLLYWLLTGSPVPQTGSAKVAFFAEQRLDAVSKLGVGLQAVAASLLGPLLLGVLGFRRAPAGGVAALFLVLWLLIAMDKLPSGLFHNHGRYLALMVPVLLYGLCSLLPTMRLRGPLSVVLLACVLVTAPVGLRLTWEAGQAGMFLAFEQDVAPNIPEGASVLLHDAGYLSWLRADLRLTDAVGLKTASSAALHAELTAPTGDRGPAIARIAQQSGAGYLVVLTGDPFWATIATALSGQGWTLDPVALSETGYSLFRIAPPGE